MADYPNLRKSGKLFAGETEMLLTQQLLFDPACVGAMKFESLRERIFGFIYHPGTPTRETRRGLFRRTSWLTTAERLNGTSSETQ
jgi:hypothetical protein